MKTKTQITESRLDELRRTLLKLEYREEVIAYGFSLMFAIAAITVVVFSFIWKKDSLPTAGIVAMLMFGFRAPLGWIRKMRKELVVLLLALLEASHPDLAKPLADARHQIQPVPSLRNAASKTSTPSAAKPEMESESFEETFCKLVTNARTLLPKVDLGATTRMLFKEYLDEKRKDKA